MVLDEKQMDKTNQTQRNSHTCEVVLGLFKSNFKLIARCSHIHANLILFYSSSKSN